MDLKLLSQDVLPTDSIYRLLRGRQIIYVTMEPANIISDQFARCYPPSVVAKIKELERWGNTWTTLALHASNCEVQGYPDSFLPHAVSPDCIVGNYPYFDIMDLANPEKLKERVFRVDGHGGRRCILKIARFRHELSYLENELRVYHKLVDCKCPLVPELIGYACEGDQSRVVGFVMEDVAGTSPSVEDFQTCEAALKQLHELGILHGDINRYNILMTERGPKFVDFEVAIIDAPRELKNSELESLRGILSVESDLGRPYR